MWTSVDEWFDAQSPPQDGDVLCGYRYNELSGVWSINDKMLLMRALTDVLPYDQKRDVLKIKVKFSKLHPDKNNGDTTDIFFLKQQKYDLLTKPPTDVTREKIINARMGSYKDQIMQFGNPSKENLCVFTQRIKCFREAWNTICIDRFRLVDIDDQIKKHIIHLVKRYAGLMRSSKKRLLAAVIHFREDKMAMLKNMLEHGSKFDYYEMEVVSLLEFVEDAIDLRGLFTLDCSVHRRTLTCEEICKNFENDDLIKVFYADKEYSDVYYAAIDKDMERFLWLQCGDISKFDGTESPMMEYKEIRKGRKRSLEQVKHECWDLKVFGVRFTVKDGAVWLKGLKVHNTQKIKDLFK